MNRLMCEAGNNLDGVQGAISFPKLYIVPRKFNLEAVAKSAVRYCQIHSAKLARGGGIDKD